MLESLGCVREKGDLVRMCSRLNGKLWEHLTEAEHQAFPGDYEAQVSQGVIPWHSEEFLALSDIGIVKPRRLLQKQLNVIRGGKDPAGVSFDSLMRPCILMRGIFW